MVGAQNNRQEGGNSPFWTAHMDSPEANCLGTITISVMAALLVAAIVKTSPLANEQKYLQMNVGAFE